MEDRHLGNAARDSSYLAPILKTLEIIKKFFFSRLERLCMFTNISTHIYQRELLPYYFKFLL